MDKGRIWRDPESRNQGPPSLDGRQQEGGILQFRQFMDIVARGEETAPDSVGTAWLGAHSREGMT